MGGGGAEGFFFFKMLVKIGSRASRLLSSLVCDLGALRRQAAMPLWLAKGGGCTRGTREVWNVKMKV